MSSVGQGKKGNYVYKKCPFIGHKQQKSWTDNRFYPNWILKTLVSESAILICLQVIFTCLTTKGNRHQAVRLKNNSGSKKWQLKRRRMKDAPNNSWGRAHKGAKSFPHFHCFAHIVRDWGKQLKRYKQVHRYIFHHGSLTLSHPQKLHSFVLFLKPLARTSVTPKPRQDDPLSGLVGKRHSTGGQRSQGSPCCVRVSGGLMNPDRIATEAESLQS